MDTNTNIATKIKVLVIDDDDNLRNVLVDALTTAGFEPNSATNGEEGLRIAFESHPDIIMLDVMMPRLTGWQVLERLRMDKWGKGARVIMLTSLGQADNIAHALDKMVATYIVKSDLEMNNIGNIIKDAMKTQLLGI